MNLRILVCTAALLTPLFSLSGHAQTTPQATDAADKSSALDAEARKELEALVNRVKAKLQGGKSAESDFADELKDFDKLADKYSGLQTENVAGIFVMKAMLYAQVFEDNATAAVIIEKGAAAFSGTETGTQLAQLAQQLKQAAEREAATAVGQEFAPFKETATDGTVVDLAAYRGKVVLVDFWATWCGPCVAELPHVKAAYDKYHDQGFEIIGISLDKDGDKLAAFTKQHKMAWPQIFDGKGWENKLAQAYGIQAIPATFLLDQNGKIVAKELRGDALSKKVGELLSKKN